MWFVSTVTSDVTLGSKTTMSASLPMAMVPFFGYMPNIFAGVVAVISTKRFRPSRPSPIAPW